MNKLKIIVTIILVTALIACENKKDSSTETTLVTDEVVLSKIQAQNAEINTERIDIRSLSETLKLNGKIDVPPQNLISISVPMGGYLKSTDLLPGMVIKKGQILAIIEDPQFVQLQQEYLLAKVKLKLSESEYLRQKELNESKAVSDKIFQQAETEFKNQKINVKALGENLQIIGIQPSKLTEENLSKNIIIRSPIDGYVAKINANIGKFLSASEVLFELVNTSDIHLNLIAFEKDIEKLKIGQKVYAYSNNHPDQKEECDIILIGHSLSTDKSTEVHCHFKKYSSDLVPGMYMTGEIKLEKQNCIAVPSSSIVRMGNDEFIFIETSHLHFKIVPVKSGNRENNYQQITTRENLKGQKVVYSGAYSLLMKLKNKKEEE